MMIETNDNGWLDQLEIRLTSALLLVDYFKATSKLFHGYFEAFLGLLQIYIVAKLSLNLTQFQFQSRLRLALFPADPPTRDSSV